MGSDLRNAKKHITCYEALQIVISRFHEDFLLSPTTKDWVIISLSIALDYHQDPACC